MDCRDEWADRVNQEQIERVLQLGEFLMMLPADQKPMRMTLAASKLWGGGSRQVTGGGICDAE